MGWPSQPLIVFTSRFLTGFLYQDNPNFMARALYFVTIQAFDNSEIGQ